LSVYINDFRKIKKARQQAHRRSRHAVARSAPGDVAVAGCGLPALAAADVGRVREMKRWREREGGRWGELYLPHWCRRRCPPDLEGTKQN